MATTSNAANLSAVEIAKLEGRMDAGFAEVGGKLDTLIARYESADRSRTEDRALADARHADLEARMRVIESHGTGDLDPRVTELEARKTVTPFGLWSVVVTALGLGIAAVALFV